MSTLRVNSLLNAAGTATPAIDGLAKAWVNFNGTGTVAIRQALNVSSITDNGTGDYVVNFTTAMPDANYSVIAGAREAVDNSSTTNRVVAPRRTTSSVATTSVRLGAVYFNDTVTDVESCYAAIFR